MKKLILLLLVVLPTILASCKSESKPNSEIESFAESLMSKYPNYESNDEAKNSMKSEIVKYGESFVGKPAPFAGVDFKFKKIVENEQTGTKSAVFESRGNSAEIANPNVKGRYLFADIQICALGVLDNSIINTLDSNVVYSLSGTVHAYDDKDLFYVGDWMLGIYFGTFILDNMTVESKSK
jgi:hypothetical protein